MSKREKDTKGVSPLKTSKSQNIDQTDGETLMVAMQPTVEEVEISSSGGDPSMIEVQEVVVVTDDIENNSRDNLKTIDLSSGQLVPIEDSEVPEVIHEFGNPRIHGSRLSDIKEPVGPSRRRPSVSSSEEDSEESESDTGYYRHRKTPKKREFAHRLQWRSKDMLDAMKAVEERKITIRGAAKKYNVPYSTLKDRVHGRVRHGTKPGVKTILSPEEEDELVRYVRDMENSGFQLRHVDVRDRAGELLRLNHGHNTPYKDNSPGHNWLGGFLKRHPGLEFKRSLSRHSIPSAAKQKQMLKKFYDVSSQIFKKHRLHHKPERIFVVSEFRMRVSQHATVLIASSADGSVLPPFVVFHGQRLKLSSARQAFPEAFFTCSFNGYVNEDIFLWWFRDHFLKKIGSISRPVVLFLSRPVTDISLQLAQRAKEERVYLIAIPTPVAHLVNPLDDELGQTVEILMTKKANKWQEENENYPFTQRVFADILRKVWRKGIASEDITSKFCQNGLFPLNNGAISADRILNATQILREAQQKAVAATPLKNDPLAGLSLLSALSSHEYASLEHMYGSNENLDHSFDQDEPEGLRAEIDTPVRSSPRKSKRRRLDDYVTEEIQPPDMKKSFDDSVNSDEETGRRKGFKVSEELMKQVLEQNQKHKTKRGRPSHASKQADRQGNVQNEIVAARENIEQINRAIDSILEKAAKDEAKKMGGSGIQIPRSGKSVNDLIHGIKSDAEDDYDVNAVTEEIVSEEVVEEQVVEEQIHDDTSDYMKMEEDQSVVPTEQVVTEPEPQQSVVEVPQPVAETVSPQLSFDQLLQNKRTILVETVVINGQKVKIVRMAPAQSQVSPKSDAVSVPTPSKTATQSPKITVIRAPRSKTITRSQQPVALHDFITEEVNSETNSNAVITEVQQIETPENIVQEELLSEPIEVQPSEEQLVEDNTEVINLEGEQEYYEQEASHHGVVTSEELSALQSTDVVQAHLVTSSQGMPVHIFEQEEVSSATEPEQIVVGEPVTASQVVEAEQIEQEELQDQVTEEVITQQVFEDQNGVRYIQVYDPATGQHQLVMEEHVVY